MKRMMKATKILFATVVISLLSTSIAKADDFDTWPQALKYWLGEDMKTRRYVLDPALFDFYELPAMAAYSYLAREKTDWKVDYVLSFDENRGTRRIPVRKPLAFHQLQKPEYAFIGAHYFISKVQDGQTVRAIVSVGGSTFCRRNVEVIVRDQDKVVGDGLAKKLSSYAQGKANFYSNSVVQMVSDEWDYKCFKYLENVSDYNYSWDDLVINHDLKDLLYQNIFQFINDFEEYDRMGKKIRRGLLFYGPPGTGKSFVAQVLVSQILHGQLKDKSTLYVVTARHLDEVENVSILFRAAGKTSPSTVFMEDIDLLGIKSRNQDSGSGNARNKAILNEFLNGMDGLVDAKASLFIGTTNQVDAVDGALSRNGRLGLHIFFDLPTYDERVEFYTRFAAKKAELDPRLTIEWLAGFSEGFSGADIMEAIGLARQYALQNNSWSADGRLYIKYEYFYEAIQRVRNNDVKSKG